MQNGAGSAEEFRDHVNKVWKCSLYYVAETQFRVSGKNGNGQGKRTDKADDGKKEPLR